MFHNNYFRFGLFFLLICLLFVFAGKKMYEIQITRHAELLTKAKNVYTSKKTKAQIRGEIYDYDGNLLVGNQNVMWLAFDAQELTDPEKRRKLAHFLSENLPGNPPYLELYTRLNSGDKIEVDKQTGEVKRKYTRYIVLHRDIDYALGEEIKKKAAGLKFSRCLIFDKKTRRIYPKNEMLSALLGYTELSGNDQMPKSGLQKVYGNEMAPENVVVKYERTRDGQMLDYDSVEQLSAGHDGSNLYLTIREPLQAIMEEEVEKTFRTLHPKTMYAVMVDPYTGDIWAMTQRPTYNPNDRSSMKDQQACRNRIASDRFEPGSVIKPFIVAMALDRGVISLNTKIDTGFGPWKYAGRRLSDTHYIGTVTPSGVIKDSSNIGTAMIAVEMGPQATYETLKAFHFGEKTGLPIPQENAGLVKHYSKWAKVDVSRACIGYTMAVTTLQLARAYSMMANGGHSINLRIIDSIESDETGRKKEPYHYDPVSVFKKPDTHKNMIKILKTVAKPGGTAAEGDIPGFNVAGKTGTARKAENGKYDEEHKKYQASFCGFVPADNPKFVLVVSCDDARGPEDNKPLFGGKASAPTFARIAKRSLEFLGVPPEMRLEDWEADRKACDKYHWKEINLREQERLSRLKSGKTIAPTGIHH